MSAVSMRSRRRACAAERQKSPAVRPPRRSWCSWRLRSGLNGRYEYSFRKIRKIRCSSVSLFWPLFAFLPASLADAIGNIVDRLFSQCSAALLVIPPSSSARLFAPLSTVECMPTFCVVGAQSAKRQSLGEFKDELTNALKVPDIQRVKISY